jgi:hypothetical protein
MIKIPSKFAGLARPTQHRQRGAAAPMPMRHMFDAWTLVPTRRKNQAGRRIGANAARH